MSFDLAEIRMFLALLLLPLEMGGAFMPIEG